MVLNIEGSGQFWDSLSDMSATMPIIVHHLRKVWVWCPNGLKIEDPIIIIGVEFMETKEERIMIRKVLGKCCTVSSEKI